MLHRIWNDFRIFNNIKQKRHERFDKNYYETNKNDFP
jgi:hypothetical protein